MKLKLVRFTLVTFGKNNEVIDQTQMKFGEIIVEMQKDNIGAKNQRLISALVNIPKPDVTPEDYIILPDESRKALENSIELFSNIISLGYSCGRTISSPNPSACIIPEDNDASDFLKKCKGIYGSPISRGKINIEIDITKISAALDDRVDGVSLMAEAQSSTHVTGKFVEFNRIFERAFGLAGARLINPLQQFLSPLFEFSESEVRNIVFDTRNPAIHADKKEIFLTSSDIAPLIDRTEQAAYDVLLNKEKWRDSSTSRRSVWKPRSRLSRGNIPTIVRGDELKMTSQIFDQFGTYPLNLNGHIHNLLPEHCWVGIQNQPFKASGLINVIDE